MKCKKCGKVNSADRKFCSECGAQLFIKCSGCGFVNDPDARFCGGCGTRLGDDPASKPEGTTPSISKELSDKFKAGARQLKGSRRDVAVVFADVSGFTRLSEGMDPEDLTEKMNAVFRTLADIIYGYDGYIDKYIGDCVMALFGAPIAHEDAPLRAVLCCIDMMAAMTQFENLRLSIGINFGRVVAGGIGSDHKMEYTVMGDTVNLAERLEELAGPGEIYISQSVFDRTKDEIEYSKLDPVNIKGKSEKVNVYLPITIKSVYDRRAVRESVMVGRDQELEDLLKLYKKTISRTGRVISIIGEAGIGKSKLIFEFRKKLETMEDFKAHQPQILETRGLEYLQSAEYRGLKQVTQGLVGIEPDDDGDTSIEKVETFISGLKEKNKQLEDTEPFIKFILDLDVGEDQRTRFEAMKAEDRMRMVYESLTQVIKVFSSTQPLIIIFDDTHWLDSATMNYAERLAEEITDNSILIIFMSRPVEKIPEFTDRTIYLKPLEQDRFRDLACKVLGCDRVSDQLIKLLLDRAEGNPFYTEELINTLIANNLIIIEKGTGSLAPDSDDLNIPGRLNDLIMARIDRLDGELRHVIQIASVIGTEFAAKLLDNILNIGTRLRTQLEIMGNRDLVVRLTKEISRIMSGDNDYAFKHIMIRDVVYNSILKRVRKDYHGKIGEIMEEIHGKNPGQYLDILAFHFDLADNKEKAAHYYTEAGSKKLDKFLNREALKDYTRAVELLNDEIEKAKLYQNIGAIYDIIGEYPKALEAYKKMDVDHPILKAKGLTKSALIHKNTGEFDLALDLLNKASQVLEKIDSEDPKMKRDAQLETTTILSHRCWIYRIKGEIEKAENVGAQAMQILNRLPHQNDRELKLIETDARNNLGAIEFMKGNYDRAIELFKLNLKIHQELDYKRGISAAANNLGIIYKNKGELKNALKYHNLDLEICKLTGDIKGMAKTLESLAVLYRSKDQFSKSLQLFRRSEQISEKLGDKHAIMGININSGNLYIDMGDYHKALECLQTALDLAREIGSKKGKAIALGNMADIYHQTCDYDKALKLYLQQMKIVEELGNKINIASVAGNIGLIYKYKGDRDKALECFERQLQLSREVGATYYMANAVGNLGLFYKETGEPEKAIEYFLEGLELAEKMENPTIKGMTLGYMGMTHYEMGNVEKSLELINRAMEIFDKNKVQYQQAEFLWYKGMILVETERFEEARPVLERAIKISRAIDRKDSLEAATKLLKKIKK